MATTTFDAQRLLPRTLIRPSYPWIIFDMDGTLVDSLKLLVASFNFAVGEFSQRKLSFEEIADIHGSALEDQLANYVPETAIAITAERYHRFFASHFNSQSIFTGIRILLFNLRRRGIKLAVCTGACRRSADTVLVRSDLAKFFAAVITCEDVAVPKPDPDGLKTTMKAIGADPGRTVYIGDHPDDINAALKAGVKSSAALWGSIHKSVLEELKPDFVFKHPAEALCLSAYEVSYVNDDEHLSRSSPLTSIAVQQS